MTNIKKKKAKAKENMNPLPLQAAPLAQKTLDIISIKLVELLLVNTA
jgi:hypothetical protein